MTQGLLLVYVHGMTQTDLLTPMERGWIRYHTQLATTRAYDIAEFSEVFMQEVTPVEPETKIEFKASDNYYVDDDYDQEFARADQERAELLRYCRPAKLHDYEMWLRNYRAKGNKVEYRRDYTWSSRNWFVLLKEPAYIPDLYGANALDLIILPRIFPRLKTKYSFANGHNNLYYMQDYRFVGSGGPASFKDVR